jgi:hypothetical protein
VTDEQIAMFYLWRTDENYVLREISCRREGGFVEEINREEWANTLPTAYFVDEAWKFWNSRNYQRVDKGVQFYNAQHRKASDDLWIGTQTCGQIDKQFRDLTQAYHTLVNHGKRKAGIFRQPSVISVIESNEPPDAQRKSLTAFPKVIKFDKVGLGGSFDTAQGAGVQGSAADIGQKVKGLPPWMMLLLVVGIGAVLILLSQGAGKLTGYLLGGTLKKVGGAVDKSIAPKAVGGGTNVPMSAVVPPSVSASVAPAVRTVGEDKPEELYVTGYSHVAGRSCVMLSDGRTVHDAELLFDGERFRWRGRILEWEPDKAREARASRSVEAAPMVKPSKPIWNNEKIQRSF